MNAKKRVLIAVCTIAVFGGGMGDTFAAKPKAPVVAALEGPAQKLEVRYAAMLKDLKSDIERSLPNVDDKLKSVFLKAHAAQLVAEAKVEAAKKAFGDLNGAKGLVGHANWWINDAKKQVAKAQGDLKKAKTDAEREALQKTISEQEARQKAGEAALKERQAAYDKAKLNEDALKKNLEAAQAVLADAKSEALKAIEALNPASFLASGALDAKLIKHQVLAGATPRGLAEFAGRGAEQETLVESLLADDALMRQMVLADGPAGGKYGEAMEIYSAIQKASGKASQGPLQRLALAVSLAHATPIKQSNPKDSVDAPKTVDPVKRYLAFEKAFLDNELDPAFPKLTAWDYLFVVNGDEPDEILSWGRQMLRNYRPDIVANPNYSWRYVQAVATEVQYGSQDVKNDLPTLQPYQNMIMNGGVCGRRAFFGRFILRAFGIPTTARPQPGHAALVHWTPRGWVVNLGAGWGSGYTHTVYGDDADFLAITQARNFPDAYLQVQRAYWIGEVSGEKRAYGLTGKNAAKGFWNIIAISHRTQVIQQSKVRTLEAEGEDLGEANESKKQEAVEAVKITDEDRKIVVGPGRVINIPAAACSKPTNSTGKIRFMPSALGGMQLHYSRTGKAEPFEYTFDAPAAGKYMLSARVVTTSANQQLLVAANGDATPAPIAVPFTIGMWDKTPPVEVTLVQGKNVLQFSRPDPVKGLTIKDFTLTPVK